jgi:SAM-dependent methyltransferase
MDQIAYWNGDAGERWVREQEMLDRMLQPFGEAALAAASVAPGEIVLDVGCGCADTTSKLAALVGREGRVVGVDASAPMLGRARERCAAFANVSLIEADASAAPIDRGAFDLLFSRFGIMFFPDPVRAFRHLRGALRRGGRAAFVCWRALADNPWATVPFEAVANVLGRPEPQPPDAPGPFSFGDATRVRAILEGAGFEAAELHSFEATLSFGGGPSLEAAAQEMARLGPVARLLADRDDVDVARALDAIRGVLAGLPSNGGAIRLGAAAWVVTSRNLA